MIRIHKPRAVPEVLRTRGRRRRRALAARYTRFAAGYDCGERTFDFDGGIYGHASVKAALIEAQHGKCCFCESKVTHVAYGDVEHYRPKKGYRQQEGDPLGRPGYYWLAYEWSNLLFACQLCNQRHKRNLFPLRDASRRARSHHDDLAGEEALFIHPAEEDPEAFIGFRKEMAYAVDDNLRGRVTIEALGLNRRELREVRFDRYRLLEALYRLAAMGVAESERARQLLEKMVGDQAEYAALARAAVAAGFSV